MSLLKPTVALRSVTDITPGLLKKLGTDAILLDVDNTLAPPASHIPYDGVTEWIDSIKKCGVHIVICSNTDSGSHTENVLRKQACKGQEDGSAHVFLLTWCV